MPINNYPKCHTQLCSLSPETSLSIITPSCEGPHQACLWSYPNFILDNGLVNTFATCSLVAMYKNLHNSFLHPIIDLLFLNSTEHHTCLLLTAPHNHNCPQAEATSWGALPVSDTTGPIWICIANQSELAVCTILEAIIHRTLVYAFP